MGKLRDIFRFFDPAKFDALVLKGKTGPFNTKHYRGSYRDYSDGSVLDITHKKTGVKGRFFYDNDTGEFKRW